ncbi:MAG: Uma2 family endonuclease [Turicibacter sp.]|nr:Uma2 family endonuclease [Turicibacter sp.]
MSQPVENQRKSELLNGVVAMAPRPSFNHNVVSGNLYNTFFNYLRHNTCSVFGDGMEVFLTEKDKVVPDMTVVCNPSLFRKNGIHGAPNLIVEVLSPGTTKSDRGYKMGLYAQCGVGEYWIVEPIAQVLEIYLLENGHYTLADTYTHYSEDDIEDMTDQERQELVVEAFSTPLFPDLKIPLADVFAKTLRTYY